MELHTLKNFIFTLWHDLWLCNELKSLFLVKRLGLNPYLKKDGGVEFNLAWTWPKCEVQLPRGPVLGQTPLGMGSVKCSTRVSRELPLGQT